MKSNTVKKATDDVVAEVKEEVLPDDTATDDATDEQTTDEQTPDGDALATALARIAELEAELAARDAAPVAASTDEQTPEADLLKSVPAPVRDAFNALQKQAEDATAALRKEREDRADAEAVTKARTDFPHLALDPAVVGPALRRLTEQDAALAKAVTDALKSANGQNESAAIFGEVGKSTTPDGGGDAYTQMVTLAKAKVTAGTAATIEQGIAAVAVESPDLYKRYTQEKGV